MPATAHKAKTKKTPAKKAAPKPSAPAIPPPVIVTGYKGFTKDFRCRGMQYEVGKTYEMPEASLCKTGIHFCTDPWDVLGYYPLAEDNRFAEVEAENPSDETSDDSKRVTKKLTVKAELGFSGWIKAAISFLFEKIKIEETPGDSSQLAASGDYSQLAASGDSSQLAASGDYSRLAASGDSSRLAASGYYSQLAASGYSSQLAASGHYSQLAASGHSSQLAASGDYSVVAAIGINNKAKAALGSWIVLAEYDSEGKPICVKSAQVDGEKVKADTFYLLKGGEFVEAE